ncbi:MAG: twin-arginine translocase TatA/TatE family subunit [Chloroflexi bacterium]|nr:twin-arginine translocase TatA/TatE family subunit [Chloroflexota bacterium]
MPIPGPMELILLLVIVLIIFGPGKLPDIGNAVGKGIREFRKASTELEDSVRGDSKPSSSDEHASSESTKH